MKSTIAVIMIKAAVYLNGWLIICAMWKLITMPLHIPFRWTVATVLWVIAYVIKIQICKRIRQNGSGKEMPHENVMR